MKALLKPLTLLLSCLATGPALAANFSPTTAAQLQADLVTAQANGQDDVVTLQANTVYATSGNGNLPFTYNSTEDNSLTITGAGAGSSVLDGGGVGGSEVLRLTTTGANASLQVNNLTAQNGVNNASDTGGISIITNGGAAVIDACTIQDNGNNFFGGFKLTSATGTVTLTNNTLARNQGGFQGGGVIDTDGDITITGNTLEQNTGTTFNGGLQVGGNAKITLTDNVFSANTGGFYGAGQVISNGGDIVLTGNTVSNNTATTFDGGLLAISNGGGLTAEGNTLTGNMGGFNGGGTFGSNAGGVTFSNNTIGNNTGTTFNGGVSVNANGGDLTADRNIVTGNSGGLIGGGAFGSVQLSTLTNNTFLDNAATSSGQGGVSAFGTNGVRFINNILAGNSVAGAAGYGAGASITSQSPIEILNNTFFANGVDPGQASAVGGGLAVNVDADTATTSIFNNIIFGNAAAAGSGQDIYINFTNGPNALIQLFNNDFTEACLNDAGGINCDYAAVLGADQGANIDADPQFVDAAADNFQLGGGSPAINSGDSSVPNLPATDHDGNPRIVAGEIDMGALEAQPGISVAPAALEFGTVEVDDSNALVVTITNNGVVPLDVTGLELSDTTNYFLDVQAGPNPCGSENFTLAAGDSCTVGVIFAPTADGVFEATLTVQSNDPDQPDFPVALTGIGKQVNINLSGGGCSLAGNSGSVSYALGALLPLAWGVTRRRARRK